MFDVVSLCREDDPPALSTHALSPPPSHTEAEPMENGAGRDSPRNTGEPARESSETKAPEREEDEPVENGGTSSNQEREGNGESIVTESGPITVEEHQTRKKTDSHNLSKRPKQMSLKSLFARTTSISSQTPTTATDPAEPPSRPRTRPSLAPSSLPPAPKLSSVEEFVSVEKEREREERVLTPLEMFQQKLVLQVSGRGRSVKGEGVESGRTVESVEEKGDSVPKPLISDDVISKLKDRPGGYYNITVGYVYIISVIVIVTVCVCVCVCVCCVCCVYRGHS